MNIDDLIHDLRARINPQYFDQPGTESYERHQVVIALEYLRQENTRLRENAKTIGELEQLAARSNNNLLVENERLREENERLRKDAERYRWLRNYSSTSHFVCRMFVTRYIGSATIPVYQGSALDAAIDAARGAK